MSKGFYRTKRSPPDGKSPPPSSDDKSVVIPGFMCQSRPVSLAVPLPAPVVLTKASRQLHHCPSTDRTERYVEKTPLSKSRSVSELDGTIAKENVQPSLSESWWTGNDIRISSSMFGKELCPKPAPRNRNRLQEKPKPAPRSLSKQTGQATISIRRNPIPVSRVFSTPVRNHCFVATAVSNSSHISVEAQTGKGPNRSIPTLPFDKQDSGQQAICTPSPSETLSPRLFTDAPSSSTIEPHFIQPLNLCDPFLDSLGLAEICSLRVDELQHLIHTTLNRPVKLSDGSTRPSFLVRIWSRGSGKYLDLLSLGELYGRGHFGQMEHFRLILEGPRTVMLQSVKAPEQHVSISHSADTGKGTGDRDCKLLLHQGPTGYCLLESVYSPGSFLGVRRNGNIMRPSCVRYDSVEARFVIQKESLGSL